MGKQKEDFLRVRVAELEAKIKEHDDKIDKLLREITDISSMLRVNFT